MSYADRRICVNCQHSKPDRNPQDWRLRCVLRDRVVERWAGCIMFERKED